MSKSKSKQEEALQFLDELDSLTPAPPSSGQTASTPSADTQGQDPTEVLAYLDEITQRSSEPTRLAQVERPSSRAGTPTIRKSSERVRLGGGTPLSRPSSSTSTTPATTGESEPVKETSKPDTSSYPHVGGGWGWGSVWSSATAAIQQAKTVVDEQVKNLPTNEQARRVLEYAKAAQLEKIGQDFKRVGLSTLTDILNVVAPPISQHEVIQVWLSHDMKGYDGAETLVYRALAKIMEQVEGGDLIVNRGNESKPREFSDSIRDLNVVDGYETAFKLAQANLDDLIKFNVEAKIERATSIQSPTTYSQVYLRVQPFWSHFDIPLTPSSEPSSSNTQMHLQFMLYLSDPMNHLNHIKLTQTIPSEWVEMWDEYEWVEELVAESLRIGVEVLGQEYVVARMGWGKDKGKGKAQPEVAESDTNDIVVVDEKEDS